jgi:hypothetical protein
VAGERRDHQDLGAGQHADHDVGSRQLGQPDRGPADGGAEPGVRPAAAFAQPAEHRPDAVAADPVLGRAHPAQLLEQPVRGGLGQPRPAGDLGEPQLGFGVGRHLEQRERAGQHTASGSPDGVHGGIHSSVRFGVDIGQAQVRAVREHSRLRIGPNGPAGTQVARFRHVVTARQARG